MQTTASAPQTLLPSINGVPLARPDEALDAAALRQRACIELLRQAAIDAGLLGADDPGLLEGALGDEAATAIEALLEREQPREAADDAACRRLHAGQPQRFAVGERVQLRHVLFAVTPGVDVVALRQRAEACLIDLRARGRDEPADRFAAAAGELSNCPSGTQGGALGWLRTEDCAPEFAREVFAHPEVGVLPRLVHSRFGLHVVEVLAREPGRVPAFEEVAPAVRQLLEQQAFTTALRQTVQRLAGAARLVGVDLDATVSPLQQ